jgi:hypothetical protein
VLAGAEASYRVADRAPRCAATAQPCSLAALGLCRLRAFLAALTFADVRSSRWLLAAMTAAQRHYSGKQFIVVEAFDDSWKSAYFGLLQQVGFLSNLVFAAQPSLPKEVDGSVHSRRNEDDDSGLLYQQNDDDRSEHSQPKEDDGCNHLLRKEFDAELEGTASDTLFTSLLVLQPPSGDIKNELDQHTLQQDVESPIIGHVDDIKGDIKNELNQHSVQHDVKSPTIGHVEDIKDDIKNEQPDQHTLQHDVTLDAEFFWTRPSTGQKRGNKPSFSSANDANAGGTGEISGAPVFVSSASTLSHAPLPWTNFHVLADLSNDAGCAAMQPAGKPALSMTTGQAPAAQSQTSQDDEFEAALAEHHALVCAWADVTDDDESADDTQPHAEAHSGSLPRATLAWSPDAGDSDIADWLAENDAAAPGHALPGPWAPRAMTLAGTLSSKPEALQRAGPPSKSGSAFSWADWHADRATSVAGTSSEVMMDVTVPEDHEAPLSDACCLQREHLGHLERQHDLLGAWLAENDAAALHAAVGLDQQPA